MGGILSQDEVDALLKNMAEKQEEGYPGPPSEQPEVEPYDLVGHEPVAALRLPSLEMVFERFCKLYQGSLSSFLRKTVEVATAASSMDRFGELIKGMPVPTSLNLFRLEPLRGRALLVFQAGLVFSMLDVLFGGKGGNAVIEGRDFTAIEKRVIERLRELALRNLQEAWQPVFKVKCRFLGSESDPQFARVAPPEDAIHIATFEVREEEVIMGSLSILLPEAMIGPIKDRLSCSFQPEDDNKDGWRKSFQPLLMGAKVDLVVELGGVEITCSDLLGLKEGDILPLNTNAEEPLLIKVEGVPKFKGYPGHYNGNMAVQIRHIEKRRL